MNCKQANQISIRTVLESFSLFPSKDHRKTAFYFAVDREEKTPSLWVDFVRNSAFDFGTGKKCDNISIVQAVRKCSVSEALHYLSQFAAYREEPILLSEDKSKAYEVVKIKNVQHPALMQYLRARNVEDQKAWVQEVHYRVNNKYYFGIAFKNDSSGYEVRNKFSKICLGKKDITTLQNDSETVRVFEGFFDFLSWKKLEEVMRKPLSDYIILNSVSLMFKIEKLLEVYENVELYLDNDDAGNNAVLKIKKWHEGVEDCRILYSNHKDLNDFLGIGKGK